MMRRGFVPAVIGLEGRNSASTLAGGIDLVADPATADVTAPAPVSGPDGTMTDGGEGDVSTPVVVAEASYLLGFFASTGSGYFGLMAGVNYEAGLPPATGTPVQEFTP